MAGMRPRRSTRHILQSAAPIAIAVFVFGISFGVLAVAAHLPGWSVVLMSILVFAGSAQFAALGVVTAGGSILTAILAGALLNLRYIATVMAVARSLPGGRLRRTLLGPVLGDPKRLGLDAAFPALFLALLWPMLSGRHAMRCALGGAAVALLLAPFTPPGIPLAGAAVVGLWLAR